MGEQDRSKALVRSFLRDSKQSIVSICVFSGVANLLMLVPAFFMLNVYDKAVAYNSLPTLWTLSLITGFLFLALALIESCRSKVLVLLSVSIDKWLSSQVYEATFSAAVKAPLAGGGMQNMHDLNALRQFITSTGALAIVDGPWVPIYILVLFAFHPLLGWMGVMAGFMFLGLAILNQRNTESGLKQANKVARVTYDALGRNLRNAEVVTSMGMLSSIQERWADDQQRLIEHQTTASLSAGNFNAIIKTLRIAVQSAAIAAGAYLVLIQKISPGMIIAGSILIGRALQPIELTVGAWKGFGDAKEQYTRLRKLLDAQPTKQKKMRLPEIDGKVEAINAAVVPPGGKDTSVRGVSCLLEAGTVCMVVGESGAGKSSFLRALLGIWDVFHGEIKISGTSAAVYDREELGPQIGYLPQAIELLDGTIADNIARFSSVDPDAVVEAAQFAGVHDLILSLPDGYDTELKLAGSGLSPGQRQRIALARALYKTPKLVILDEPNSNLDEAGEDALDAAIKSLKKLGSTVVIVSHRKRVLQHADTILLLKGGQMQDFGSSAQIAEHYFESDAPIARLPPSRPRLPVVNVSS